MFNEFRMFLVENGNLKEGTCICGCQTNVKWQYFPLKCNRVGKETIKEKNRHN